MAAIVLLNASSCSAETRGQSSFELCGERLTVGAPYLAYDWGQRFGDTDGAKIINVVPAMDPSVDPPDQFDDVVAGYEVFHVSALSDAASSDGTMVNLGYFTSKLDRCRVSVMLFIGDAARQAIPGTGYPWTVAFVEDDA